ncbi:flagellar basal body-associated protein FliL [Pseudidiomarina aestuarii]|uniref:Flagellar protein FliL n=1 Tax=Pseudidiomarina aestuarii TaxID=624146 RepID=A0A7Z6ZVU7_9GAMM|nr:flagellar basal body-associated protein FliL [Pseudidiomarina aestuarii]RUO42151.1 flagellar basal body-associated protein FliL [Pseudidiomarina aestuarii]
MARKSDTPAPASGSNNLVIYVLLFLAIAVAGANTYLLMDTRNIALAAANGEVMEKEQEAFEPVFVSISPFTVNLRSDQFGPRLLYAGLTLEVPDEKVKQLLLTNMPQVRNRLLVLLSGQDAEKIVNSDGKKTLAASIQSTLQAPYKGDEEIAINDVLFTEFIVQ